MQLDTRLGHRKPPLHRTRVRIDGRRPCRHLAGPRLPIRQTPRQTLAAQHADLAFRDVQPASVLGRMVDLKAAAQPPGLLGRIDMIPAGQLVRVPVVHHQHDLPVRKVNIRQVRQQGREVRRGAALGDLHRTPAQQRGTHHEQVGRAGALILAVDANRLPPVPAAYLRRQLLGYFVHAHRDRIVVEVPVIDIRNIFHRDPKVGILLEWNAPVTGLPRVQEFFNVHRAFSVEMLSTTSSSTRYLLSGVKLGQRAGPSRQSWRHTHQPTRRFNGYSQHRCRQEAPNPPPRYTKNVAGPATNSLH